MATAEYLVELNEAIKERTNAIYWEIFTKDVEQRLEARRFNPQPYEPKFYPEERSFSLKRLLYDTFKQTRKWPYKNYQVPLGTMPAYEDMTAPEVSIIIHSGWYQGSESKHRGYVVWNEKNMFDRSGVEIEGNHLHLVIRERTCEFKIRSGKANIDRAVFDIAYHQLIAREVALCELLEKTETLEEEDSDSEWEQDYTRSWSGIERRRHIQWKEMRAELRNRLAANIQKIVKACQTEVKDVKEDTTLSKNVNESFPSFAALPDEISLRILSFLQCPWSSCSHSSIDMKSLSNFGTTSKQNHQLYYRVLYLIFAEKKSNMEKEVVIHYHSIDSLFDGFTKKDIIEMHEGMIFKHEEDWKTCDFELKASDENDGKFIVSTYNHAL